MARSLAPFKLTMDDEPLLDIVIDVLATYRLTTLIKDDKITEDIRRAVWKRYGEPSDEDSHKISYLMTCPWCLSVYFGAVAVAGQMRFPKIWRPFAKALALSATAGLLAEARG
ncbi:MAG: DUF1360 domain-containing protein [Nocardioidaceae bacterium]